MPIVPIVREDFLLSLTEICLRMNLEVPLLSIDKFSLSLLAIFSSVSGEMCEQGQEHTANTSSVTTSVENDVVSVTTSVDNVVSILGRCVDAVVVSFTEGSSVNVDSVFDEDTSIDSSDVIPGDENSDDADVVNLDIHSVDADVVTVDDNSVDTDVVTVDGKFVDADVVNCDGYSVDACVISVAGTSVNDFIISGVVCVFDAVVFSVEIISVNKDVGFTVDKNFIFVVSTFDEKDVISINVVDPDVIVVGSSVDEVVIST